MVDFFVMGATSESHAEGAVWAYIARESDEAWIEELRDDWTVRTAFYGYSTASRVRVVPR